MSGSNQTVLVSGQNSLQQPLLMKGEDLPEILTLEPQEILSIQVKTIKGEIEAHDAAVTALETTPESKYIISGSADKKIHIWNTLLKKIESTMIGHTGEITCLLLSSDMKYLLSGSKDKDAKLYDFETRSEITTFKGHSADISGVALAENLKYVLTCSNDGNLKIWDYQGNLIKNFENNPKRFTCCIAVQSSAICGTSDGRLLAWDLALLSDYKEIKEESAEIVSLTASIDGNLFACAERDKIIQVWDGKKLQLVFEIKGKDKIKQIRFSGNSKYLVVVSDDFYCYIWNVDIRKLDFSINYYPKKPLSVCVNYDCSIIVNGFSEKCFRIWNSCERRDESTIYIHESKVSCIACTNDDKYLLSGSFDKTLKIYDLETQNIEWEYKPSDSKLSTIYSLNRYKSCLLSSHADGSVKFWDLNSSLLIKSSTLHDDLVCYIAVSNELPLAASGSDDNKIIIWDLNSYDEAFVLSDSTHSAVFILFYKNSSKLISGGEDNCIKIWSIDERIEEHSISGHNDHIWGLALSVDNNYLFSCSRDKTIKMWDLNNYSNLHTFEGHEKAVRKILIMSSKKRLISASYDKLIKFWNIKKKELDFTLEGHELDVRSIILNDDETKLISCGEDLMIIIWNIESRSIKFKLSGHTGWVRDLVLVDKSFLISCSDDKTIMTWDLKSRKRKKTLLYATGKIFSIAVSNDGRFAAFGEKLGQVLIIEFITRTISVVGIHSNAVFCVAISNESKLIASGDEGGIIKIWNAETLREEASLTGHSNKVTAVAFNYNSKLLISGSIDDSFKIWNLISKKLEQTFNYKQSITCLVSSKIQDFAYFGCNDKNVRAVNLSDRKVKHSIFKSTSVIGNIILDNTEKFLIFSEYNLICVFDTSNNILMFTLYGHSRSSLNGLAYLAKKKRIISCSDDQSIKVWKLTANRDMKTIKFEDDCIISLDITADKQLLICGTEDGEIKIWKTENRSLYFFAKAHADLVWIIRISSDNQRFVSGSKDKLIKVWSLIEKKLLFTLEGHSMIVRGIFFINNDQTLVSCSMDKTIRYWDVLERKEVNIINYSDYFYCMHLHRDLIVTGSQDKKIVFWKFTSKEFELVGHDGSVDCLTSINETLLSGSEDKTIKCWNVNEKTLLFTLSSHTAEIRALLLLNEEILISSSEENIKIWNLSNQVELESLNSHNDRVHRLVKLNDCKFISCSSDKTLRLWDVKNKENSTIFKGATENFTTLTATSTHLFLGSYNGSVTIFDLNDQKESKIIWAHEEKVTCFELYKHENKTILVTGSQDSSIKFWNLETEELIDSKTGHSDWVRRLRITPDQQFMISASLDNHMIIWRLDNRSIFKMIAGHNEGVFDIRVNKEGSHFFSSSEDLTIRVWELNTGSEVCCLFGHTGSIWNIVLIEEQKQLISCSSDKLIKVWDYESKRESFTFKGHQSIVNRLELSNNKKYLISGDDEGILKIWNLPEKRLEFSLVEHKDCISGLSIINEKNILCSVSLDGVIKFWQTKSSSVKKQREIRCGSKSFTCDHLFISEAQDTLTGTEDSSHQFLPSHALDVGFNDIQVFYSFTDCLKANDFSNFHPNSSSIKISSCLFGAAHVLAFLGKEKELTELLTAQNIIFSDTFGKSPFYYALTLKHNKCAEIILDFLIKSSQLMQTQEWESSMFSIRNDFGLMIRSSIHQITKFLKYSMISSIPTSLSLSVNLPFSKFNQFQIPNYIDFDSFSPDSVRVQAYFMTLQLPLSSRPGSEESIELLNSMLMCQDKEIFSVTVIKELIDYYWNSLYSIILFNSFTYFLNIYLMLSLFAYGFSWYLAIPFLVVNLILAVWEIAQITVSWNNYIEDIWNIIDILRLVLSIIWLFFIDSDFILLNMIVVLFNFIRGITAFKMFDGTRYYIKLIFRSISEIKYFLLMFAYSNSAFGALYSLRSDKSKDFPGSLFKMYNINFGYFDVEELISSYDLGIFMVATLINLIIMLNLLISIIGDFHDQFQLERIIIDYQEKAETCLEIQQLLFWRRELNERHYLHKALKVGDKDYNETWEGRILFLKNQILELGVTLNHLNVNLTDKISKKIETTGIEIKEKFENDLRENHIKEGENHSLIESKVKEIVELIESKQKGNDEVIKLLETKIETKVLGLETKIDNNIQYLENKVEKMIKEENKEIVERLNLMENGIMQILQKLNS